MYLLCDVETSGLPLFGADNPADAPWQPRMASIAAALLDENGIVIDRFDHLIKPTDWPLDNEQFVKNMENAQQIHGLAIERLQTEGVPLMTAHDDWQRLYDKCQYFVAYSAPFDHKIVRGEWKRLGHPIPFREKQFMCLMKAARPLCGLNKNPKLGQAVQILLGKEHTTAHTAAGDVDVSIELHRYLKERDALVIEDQPEAKSQVAA
jgi:DNA polymerase III epsilon subunit-like protein